MAQLRDYCDKNLELGKDGLEEKNDLVRRFVTIIINDENAPEFRDGFVVEASAPAVAVTTSYARALQATAGLIVRKLPRPRFAPLATPAIEVMDLTMQEFHGRSPVKSVVDIILHHRDVRKEINEDRIKQCVVDGDTEKLPAVCRPPAGCTHVNHFTQTAFVAATAESWNIIKFITFQSEGPTMAR